VFQRWLMFVGDNGHIHTDNAFVLNNHDHAHNVDIGNRQTSVIALNAPNTGLVLRIFFAIRKNYFFLLSLNAFHIDYGRYFMCSEAHYVSLWNSKQVWSHER